MASLAPGRGGRRPPTRVSRTRPLNHRIGEGPPGRGAKDDELEWGQLVDRPGLAAAAAVSGGLRAEQDRCPAGDALGQPGRPVAEVEQRPAPIRPTTRRRGPAPGSGRRSSPSSSRADRCSKSRRAGHSRRAVSRSRYSRRRPARGVPSGHDQLSRAEAKVSSPWGSGTSPCQAKSANSCFRPSRTASTSSGSPNEQKNGNGFSSPYSSPMNSSGRYGDSRSRPGRQPLLRRASRAARRAGRPGPGCRPGRGSGCRRRSGRPRGPRAAPRACGRGTGCSPTRRRTGVRGPWPVARARRSRRSSRRRSPVRKAWTAWWKSSAHWASSPCPPRSGG